MPFLDETDKTVKKKKALSGTARAGAKPKKKRRRTKKGSLSPIPLRVAKPQHPPPEQIESAEFYRQHGRIHFGKRSEGPEPPPCFAFLPESAITPTKFLNKPCGHKSCKWVIKPTDKRPGQYQCTCTDVSCRNCSVCDGTPVGGSTPAQCKCQICNCHCARKCTVGQEAKNLAKELKKDFDERQEKRKGLAVDTAEAGASLSPLKSPFSSAAQAVSYFSSLSPAAMLQQQMLLRSILPPPPSQAGAASGSEATVGALASAPASEPAAASSNQSDAEYLQFIADHENKHNLNEEQAARLEKAICSSKDPMYEIVWKLFRAYHKKDPAQLLKSLKRTL